MRTIKQRTNCDCGAACLAMIARVPYDTAFWALYGKGPAHATTVDDMKQAFLKLGVRAAGRRQSFFGRRWDALSLPFDALLYCNYRSSTNSAHWTVWDSKAKTIRDPLKKPYKRPRIHSYLRVQR